jgi:hypothetical protein
MKCCNSVRNAEYQSAFNAQGSRLVIIVVQLGAVKIYVAAAAEALSGKRKDRMKLSLPPKLMVF